jgi:predicted GNAT family N-acyltransferase
MPSASVDKKHAIPFYRRHGFVPVGAVFMEAGIPHQRMEIPDNG